MSRHLCHDMAFCVLFKRQVFHSFNRRSARNLSKSKQNFFFKFELNMPKWPFIGGLPCAEFLAPGAPPNRAQSSLFKIAFFNEFWPEVTFSSTFRLLDQLESWNQPNQRQTEALGKLSCIVHFDPPQGGELLLYCSSWEGPRKGARSNFQIWTFQK